ANHRRTVHWLRANPARSRRPSIRIDAEMQRRCSREDREYAVHRTEMTAPDALALSIDETDRYRGQRRSSEHEERRRGVLIDAYELPEDRRQCERREWPSAPAQPARDPEAEPVAARGLGKRSFWTEHTAPCAAEHEHRCDDERPPQSPEQPLRRDDQVVVPVRTL